MPFRSQPTASVYGLQLSRSVYHYKSVARDASAVAMRIREITETHVHYGYRRVHVVLQREDWRDNHKRVYRLYREQGLSLRHKRPRRSRSARRRLRLLTVIGLYPRECLVITVGQSLRGEEVRQTLERVKAGRGCPSMIKADNGSELDGKIMDRWAYENAVEIDFSRPGNPTDNATVESFSGSLRAECLNANSLLSLDDAQEKIEQWRVFYSQVRPHSAIEWLTPCEYAARDRISVDRRQAKEPEFPS